MRSRLPVLAAALSLILISGVGSSIARQTPQGRGPAKAKAAVAALNAAQQGAAPSPGAPPAAPATGAEPAVTSGGVLENVQKQEEAAASGKGLTYDPGDRRDPFVSPAEAMKANEVGQCEGEGMECWLIAEVQLAGVLQRRSGNVALVVGPEGYGGTLKPGDKLYDGEVLSVDAATGTVVFRQKVNDPTRIKPYRDIEKKLNVTREGGV
jgi:Tfp pilus assembly protein PilP